MYIRVTIKIKANRIMKRQVRIVFQQSYQGSDKVIACLLLSETFIICLYIYYVALRFMTCYRQNHFIFWNNVQQWKLYKSQCYFIFVYVDIRIYKINYFWILIRLGNRFNRISYNNILVNSFFNVQDFIIYCIVWSESL